jgi:transcriptional regulator with XRE-family HTH domain
MYQNFKSIEPLNWEELVAETIRRRKHEGITQKDHAMMAGVSLSTLSDFDRGMTTLTLQKIIDILNVVGLVAAKRSSGQLMDFCERAEQRWYKLVQTLVKEHVALDPRKGRASDQTLAHIYGAFTYTFKIIKDTSAKTDEKQLRDKLKVASNIKYTRDSPFYIYSNNPLLKPYPIHDNIVECWNKELEQDTSDHFFWWATTDGLFHYHKGYMEDNREKGSPGKVLYIDVAIAHAVEMILFAVRIGRVWSDKNDESIKIEMLLNYRGLVGRRLAADEEMIQSHVCKQDLFKSKITFDVECVSDGIEHRDSLIGLVYDLLSNLFQMFDFYKIRKEYIAHKIERTINDRQSIY